MSRRGKRAHTPPHTRIRLLAYMHRYVFLVLAPLLPAVLLKPHVILGMGIGMLSYGLYTLIGYLRRWKHIYCSFQDIAHQKMTPGSIHWSHIRKTDVYGVTACFCVMGLAMIVCHCLGL